MSAVQAVALAQQEDAAAARELCTLATLRLPHSAVLSERWAELGRP